MFKKFTLINCLYCNRKCHKKYQNSPFEMCDRCEDRFRDIFEVPNNVALDSKDYLILNNPFCHLLFLAIHRRGLLIALTKFTTPYTPLNKREMEIAIQMYITEDWEFPSITIFTDWRHIFPGKKSIEFYDIPKDAIKLFSDRFFDFAIGKESEYLYILLAKETEKFQARNLLAFRDAELGKSMIIKDRFFLIITSNRHSLKYRFNRKDSESILFCRMKQSDLSSEMLKFLMKNAVNYTDTKYIVDEIVDKEVYKTYWTFCSDFVWMVGIFKVAFDIETNECRIKYDMFY